MLNDAMSFLNLKRVRLSREQILVDSLIIHNVLLMCLKGMVYRHFSKHEVSETEKFRYDSYMILFQICCSCCVQCFELPHRIKYVCN